MGKRRADCRELGWILRAVPAASGAVSGVVAHHALPCSISREVSHATEFPKRTPVDLIPHVARVLQQKQLSAGEKEEDTTVHEIAEINLMMERHFGR
ncbi:hypothetical protein J6590_094336 [Homalodisca vitripennis]|nr:hypothetical protein J6590_094336 [Homalodisca vitripennis]